MGYTRFTHIIHYGKINVSEMCEKTSLAGDFQYFTKISTDYVDHTPIAKHMFMALECGVCRELVCKSAALRTLRTPRAAPLHTLSLQIPHSQRHTYIF